MGIKGLFGFCECKGCKNRWDYKVDIIKHYSDGSKKIKKAKICQDHAEKVASIGKITSVYN